MRRYRALLEGENFLVESENGLELLGFFTTRWIKANSAEEAEIRAIELIRTDKSLLSTVRKDHSSQVEPRVYLKELACASRWEYFWRAPGGSYTFYSMDQENE